jgi:hypothetical protein
MTDGMGKETPGIPEDAPRGSIKIVSYQSVSRKEKVTDRHTSQEMMADGTVGGSPHIPEKTRKEFLETVARRSHSHRGKEV